ncbi:uncharacterized protein LOC135503129 [Lineus longissimus]|uniref:uncharacterized protein LOC135503129 n=1 Tax=Lineus longissimus TaxID=88925 RepID=UPI00315C5A16
MFRHLPFTIGVAIVLLSCLEARPYAIQEEYLPLDDEFEADAFRENGDEKRSMDLSVSGSLAALSDMLMWQRQQQQQQQLNALGKRGSEFNNQETEELLKQLQLLRDSASGMRKRSGSELSVMGSLDALSDIISSQNARHKHDMMQANHQRLLRLGKRDTSANLEKTKNEETKKAD